MGNLVFYTVFGTVIALVAQAMGATMMLSLLASLVVPPFLLLVRGVIRFNSIR